MGSKCCSRLDSVLVVNHRLVLSLVGTMVVMGHVAVVTAVESSTRIQVSECNYMVVELNQLEIIVDGLIRQHQGGTVRYIYPN